MTLDGGAGTPAGAVSSIAAWNALAEGPGAAGSAGGRSSPSTQAAFMAAAANAYSSLIWSTYAGVGVSARGSDDPRQHSPRMQHSQLVALDAHACSCQGSVRRAASWSV